MTEKTKNTEKKVFKRSVFHKMVNAFVAFFVFVLVLTFLLIGFSQTSYFRTFLKNQISSRVNKSISGEVFIGSISGSIFTTFEFTDFGLKNGKDTIFVAEKFNLRLGLYSLLNKKILIKKIEIVSPHFFLREDENVQLNLISALATNLDSTETLKDTLVERVKEDSKFPFKIEVASMNVANGKFVSQDFKHVKSDSTYNSINWNDIQLSKINLSLKAIADLNTLDFLVEINDFNFRTNVPNFNVKNLNSKISVSPKGVFVERLKLNTDSSNIDLSAKLDGLNIFEHIDYVSFKNYPVKINLKTKPFHFSDLTTFLPNISFLRGPVNANLSGKGKYGEIDIQKLNLEMGETDLNLVGKLKNLEKPENLFIEAKISKSEILYNNIWDLLAGLDLPFYDSLKLQNVEIEFKGEPINFYSSISADVDKGKILTNGKLDFTDGKLLYDLFLETKQLNLEKIIAVNSKLNLNSKIKGEGVDLKTMQNNIELSVLNSTIDKFNIDNLNIKEEADSGFVEMEVLSNINKADIGFDANINLTSEEPVYSILSSFNNLDLTKFFDDPSLTSNLNFNMALNSESFNQQKMNGDFEVMFDSSEYRGSYALSDKDVSLNLWTDENGQNIDLKSDIIDAEVTGHFYFEDVVNVVSTQFDRIVKTLNNEFVSSFSQNLSKNNSEQISNENLSKHLIDLNYNIVFKDAEILAQIFNFKNFSASGYLLGSIENDSSSFNFSHNSYLSNLLFINNEDLVFLDNFALSVDIENSNLQNNIEKIDLSIHNTANRMFLGENFTKTKIDLDFTKNILLFNLSSTLDSTINFKTAGNLTEVNQSKSLDFNLFSINFGDNKIENEKPFTMKLENGNLFTNGIELNIDSSLVKLKGKLDNKGELDISLNSNELKLSSIMKLIVLENTPDFEGNLNFDAKLKGTIQNPEFDLDLTCENFQYQNIDFGNIYLTNQFRNYVSNFSLTLIDEKSDKKLKVLDVIGNLPLPFNEAAKYFVNEDDEIEISLRANDFNIAALSTLIPQISKQRGVFNSELKVTGKFSNPIINGFANLENTSFNVVSTNMGYNLNAALNFQNNKIELANLTIANHEKSDVRGTLNIGGELLLKNYKFSNINLDVSGSLGLLNKNSRFSSPNFYGNLLVATDGKWNLDYSNEKAFLTGSLIIKEADLTIATESNTEVISENDIIYVYKTDNKTNMKTEFSLDKYLFEKFKSVRSEKEDEENSFSYDINFEIENRALVNFIISRTANQKLSVITNGSLQLKDIDNEASVQGVFNLLQGSKFEFLKTFDATGFIRFERDLINPYIDIVSVYEGSYTKIEADNSVEEKVAVKIKLNGLLSEIGKTITEDKTSISVYVGKKNIEGNIPDPKLDASDAFSFILIGKFNSELTSNEQVQLSDELTNTATAMLGTVMAGFLNSQVGDLINDIQVRQTSTATKVTLKGRVGQFYYSLGGDLNTIQDISQANWKVEYFFNKNLSFRVERREPITGFLSTTQMTDEVAIKYRVSF